MLPGQHAWSPIYTSRRLICRMQGFLPVGFLRANMYRQICAVRQMHRACFLRHIVRLPLSDSCSSENLLAGNPASGTMRTDRSTSCPQWVLYYWPAEISQSLKSFTRSELMMISSGNAGTSVSLMRLLLHACISAIASWLMMNLRLAR